MTAITSENSLQNKTQTADFLCYLFIIFLAGCLVGWFYEEIFYWITEGMLRNRGVLYGPWLPIYGIGALGIYALKPVKFGLVVHDGTQGVQCPTVFFQIALRSADGPDHASAES